MLNWARDYWDPNRDLVTFFHLLKSPARDWIEPSDFYVVIETIIQNYEALDFLQASPEFRQRFTETAVTRIFFSLDQRNIGKIRFADLRKYSKEPNGDILAELNNLDASRIFSYEQFYVIYCSFWEIDCNHDFLLSKEDVLRYDNHAISRRAIERIFSQIPRRFHCAVPNHIGYEDFMFLLICYHDRSCDVSLKFWFAVMDVDGDGVIRVWELRYFFEEQRERMESLNYEALEFDDVVCQVHDLIRPAKACQFTMEDLKRSRQNAGSFFSLFLSLNKLLVFEHKGAYSAHANQQGSPILSDWDYFCSTEYGRLAMDELGD